jgi:hypothetical protein
MIKFFISPDYCIINLFLLLFVQLKVLDSLCHHYHFSYRLYAINCLSNYLTYDLGYAFQWDEHLLMTSGLKLQRKKESY